MTNQFIPLEMIFNTFKKTLKAKDMTYSDLALKLNLSESGIKKIFISEDCSYSRLNAISEVLELSLVDILTSSLDHEIQEVHFTMEQEQYFVKHPQFFNFFWKLIQERENLDNIKSEFGFKEKECFQFLKKLDEFGILELHAKDVIKIPKMQRVKWMGNGPLMKWMKTAWPKKIIEDLISKEKLDTTDHYSLRYYKLTKKSQLELVQAIQHIDNEFAERSLREIKSGKKINKVRMVSAITSGSYISNKDK